MDAAGFSDHVIKRTIFVAPLNQPIGLFGNIPCVGKVKQCNLLKNNCGYLKKMLLEIW
jgi:hypothetical protein